ncbi:protein GVQW3-like [Oratosquilla oratoria]|uniref:protein GVQW3-like n=1 Tax=Oratosquilla oratoria TaxID=337810 RepID=UPI003F76C444
MDKIGYQAVLLYLHIKGLTPKEIHKDMVATLQDNTPSYSMAKKWAADFKQGRDSLENDPRQGRPPTVTTQKISDKIHEMLLTDLHLTERFIATEVGVSQERVHAIVHNHLEITKVSAQWVPKLLGPNQKWLQCNMSKNNLAFLC